MNEPTEPKNKQAAILGFLTSSAFIKPLLFAIFGGIFGYLFYYFIGCSSGSCGITSNSYLSILFGAAIGFYASSSPCSGNKC